MSLTTTTSPVLPTHILLPFEGITAEIRDAEETALPVRDFEDYKDPTFNKSVRSYLYRLRQLRSSLERHRKAQNDEAQAAIRTANSHAAQLKDRVTALIDPHDAILKRIDDIEKERIATHQRDIDTISEMRQAPYGNSDRIQKLLDDLTEIDPDTFEEFTPKADAEIQLTRTALEEALQIALDHEEAEAARERKRQQEAADAKARREAEIAEEAAAKAREEAAQEIEAERKKAEDAQKVADAERDRRVLAEQEVEEVKKAVEYKATAVEIAPLTREPEAAEEPTLEQKAALLAVIEEIILDNKARAAARMLISGEAHPAIVIDWSKVKA